MGGNGFPEEDELCNNNGRCDCNFRHLVETYTAHELNSEDTRQGLIESIKLEVQLFSCYTLDSPIKFNHMVVLSNAI